ncbi:hypothetical protein BT69DRAFT_1352510 [Atractiella rhizophila]|nr:hypothetical protein BT69DRAFT_1352510 [Atractiella rhizophila]
MAFANRFQSRFRDRDLDNDEFEDDAFGYNQGHENSMVPFRNQQLGLNSLNSTRQLAPYRDNFNTLPGRRNFATGLGGQVGFPQSLPQYGTWGSAFHDGGSTDPYLNHKVDRLEHGLHRLSNQLERHEERQHERHLSERHRREMERDEEYYERRRERRADRHEMNRLADTLESLTLARNMKARAIGYDTLLHPPLGLRRDPYLGLRDPYLSRIDPYMDSQRRRYDLEDELLGDTLDRARRASLQHGVLHPLYESSLYRDDSLLGSRHRYNPMLLDRARNPYSHYNPSISGYGLDSTMYLSGGRELRFPNGPDDPLTFHEITPMPDGSRMETGWDALGPWKRRVKPGRRW